MNAASLGFAAFLILAAAAAVLLVRLVIRGVRGGHSTSSGFTDGYFFSDSGGDGGHDRGDGWGGDCGGGDGGGGGE